LILVQPEVGTEVNALHLLVLGETLRGPVLEDHAIVNNVGAIGDSERLADVVVDVTRRFPGLRVEDDLLDVVTAMGSMPAGLVRGMNFGEMTSARVISTRRRSPPDR
jgi:hypothetical protein